MEVIKTAIDAELIKEPSVSGEKKDTSLKAFLSDKDSCLSLLRNLDPLLEYNKYTIVF